MTALRIDTAKFKECCETARYRMQAKDELTQRILARGIRKFYNVYLDRDYFMIAEPVAEEVEEIDPAEELRSRLRAASRARQQFGATEAQIGYIVALAEKRGNFNVLGNSHTLTKGEASIIIDNMKKG